MSNNVKQVKTDFSECSDLELSFFANEELRKRGYYVFIAEPNTDFNPDKFDVKGADHGMNGAFAEVLWALDAEPLEQDE